MSKGVRFTDEFKQDAVAQVMGTNSLFFCETSLIGQTNSLLSILGKSSLTD